MIQSGEYISGKWIATYPEQTVSSQQMLEICHDIQSWLLKKKLDRRYKRIHLNASSPQNSYMISRNSIAFELRNRNLANVTRNQSLFVRPHKNKLLSRQIKKILLLYPAMLSDKRWKSIQLPTPWLLLGSGLEGNRFQVHIEKPVFPPSNPRQEWFSFDLLGFTLYEDQFDLIQLLFNRMGKQYRGLLAAGGPFITLNPLESAYHLPEINLLIRGEAEFVLPRLLHAIGRNDIHAMMDAEGFLFRKNGLMVISDLNRINRPKNFLEFDFNLDFLKASHLSKGLEANMSRGCSRGCVFCSRLQGKTLRKIPINKIEQLLNRFSEKLKSEKIDTPDSRTININDDDLLQDPGYADEIFRLAKKYRFKLWGIQTSINSCFNQKNEPDREIIERVSDRSLFVNETPLLWLGTDAFIKKRGKKLGKVVPNSSQIESLLQAFENNRIQNYHYWISSDHLSDWKEFITEFLFIVSMTLKYSTFHILAHAPFLIPYSCTPLYRLLARNPEFKNQIQYRAILKTGRDAFDLRLVYRVETRYPVLNRLLKNEISVPPVGFFDYLKTGDILDALKTVYNFLKQERLSFDSSGDKIQVNILEKLEGKIENHLKRLL